MENASEALGLAGSVLIFIVALSIIILFFTQVRTASDAIVKARDRETFYYDTNYYYAQAKGIKPPDIGSITKSDGSVYPAVTYNKESTRIVGMETILQTITRAYLENYKIMVYDNTNNELPLFTLKYTPSSNLEINYFDLETAEDENNVSTNVVISGEQNKAIFLKGILYGEYTEVSQTDFARNFNIINPPSKSDSFYHKYKDKQFYEFFGVYKQNDDNENTPDIMKVDKRVITYVMK